MRNKDPGSKLEVKAVRLSTICPHLIYSLPVLLTSHLPPSGSD